MNVVRIVCDQCGAGIDAGERDAESVECRQCFARVFVSPRRPLFAPPEPAPEPLAPVGPPREGPLVEAFRHRCADHPSERAHWKCTGCQRYWCRDCAREVQSFELTLGVCRCKARLVEVQWSGNHEVATASTLADAFRFPWRHPGGVLLTTAAAVPWLIERVANLHPSLAPLQYLLLLVLPTGFFYVGGFLFQVVRQTASRPDDPLDWHDVTDIGDMLGPAFVFGLATLLYLGPGLMLAKIVGGIGLPLLLAGLIALPMALLRYAMVGGLSALSPVEAATSLRRTSVAGSGYCLLVTMLLLTALGWLALAPPVPGLGLLLQIGGTLYLATAAMRLLGQVYRINSGSLGWF